MSPALFTNYLAFALKEIREQFPWLSGEDCSFPCEWGCADDVDFISEDKGDLEDLLPILQRLEEKWLYVNADKTEFVFVHLAEDVAQRGKEE